MLDSDQKVTLSLCNAKKQMKSGRNIFISLCYQQKSDKQMQVCARMVML
jgi:hypothetical protein